MKRFTHNVFFFAIGACMMAVCASCTSTQWVVKDKSAVDSGEKKILSQKFFLAQDHAISPQNPVVRLKILSRAKFNYTQKVLEERAVQHYRLQPGFIGATLAGSAMAFYAGNSDHVGRGSHVASFTLNLTGLLLAAAGFFNLKPSGKPRFTGEQRYLRNTGKSQVIDTVEARGSFNEPVTIRVSHNNDLVFEDHRRLRTTSLVIPLSNKLNDLKIKRINPRPVNVKITFQDSVYHYRYAIKSILNPYAKITSRLTALRAKPEINQANISANLMKGSQVRILESDNPNWYKVKYGTLQRYVNKQDIHVIWRPSDFAQNNHIVTAQQVPFGNIDVESYIPILRGYTPNAVGLIITNEHDGQGLPKRNYALRDGKLVAQYLKGALGYPSQNILMLKNVSGVKKINKALEKIRNMTNSKTQIFVYLSGFGGLTDKPNSPQLTLLPAASDQQQDSPINVGTLLKKISRIPSSQTIVLNAIDFSLSKKLTKLKVSELKRIARAQADNLTASNAHAVMIMGSHLSQPNRLYFTMRGVDKKHSIFPYFFFQSLQNKVTNISDIYSSLQRNVTYTSRKLHNRPQDPLIFGNENMSLIPK